MEEDTWKEEVSRWLPSRLCPDSPLLCCLQMLLFLTLWALVPCLVLLTLYFLSSVGGKSGGNKKNDGVKVSPQEPAGLPLGRDLLSGLREALASPVVTRQSQGQALPRSPHLCSPDHPICAPVLTSQEVCWEQTGVGGVTGGLGCPEHRRRADLEEGRSGALWGKLCKGAKGVRNGH